MGDYLDNHKPIGANVRRLMIEFSSTLAVRSGSGTPMQNALNILAKPGGIAGNMREALRQTELALEAMKAAPDNPYGNDDEAIAGEILEELAKRELSRNTR